MCRHEMQSILRDKLARDVSVMTGAEANGFGEMYYGAGRYKSLIFSFFGSHLSQHHLLRTVIGQEGNDGG